MFKGLEPRCDVGRWCLWTTGPQTSDLDNRESSGPHDYYESDEFDERDSWFHVAFLVLGLRLVCAA
jgi:hypothetical protein